LFSKDSLENNGHRVGNSPFLFEIDLEEAWDIDTMLDFMIVDLLMNQNQE
jgi:CMP-N-acetylneuraminic acid synthetase